MGDSCQCCCRRGAGSEIGESVGVEREGVVLPMPPCIYCGGEADSEEHWLPRALGTFGPLQVLQGVLCNPCNNAIGKVADEEFLKTGPEATHRQSLGILGKDGAGSDPFYYKAATSHPTQARVVSETEDHADGWAEANHLRLPRTHARIGTLLVGSCIAMLLAPHRKSRRPATRHGAARQALAVSKIRRHSPRASWRQSH